MFTYFDLSLYISHCAFTCSNLLMRWLLFYKSFRHQYAYLSLVYMNEETKGVHLYCLIMDHSPFTCFYMEL